MRRDFEPDPYVHNLAQLLESDNFTNFPILAGPITIASFYGRVRIGFIPRQNAPDTCLGAAERLILFPGQGGAGLTAFHCEANLTQDARARMKTGPLDGHSLRAGCVTQAAINGVREFVIQRQTGHKTVSILRRYIRTGEIFREKAAAGLGIGSRPPVTCPKEPLCSREAGLTLRQFRLGKFS